MRSLYIRLTASMAFGLYVWPAAAQLLPSQAKGAARAQVVMLSVNDKGCAAGIIVGYDEKAVYVATATHITDLFTKPFPSVAVRFEGLSKSPHAGKFWPQFEKRKQGDLALVTVDRDDEVNKFLVELDFALLSPVPVGPANAPITSIGCYGGAYWSSGVNETLLTPAPTQGYLQFQSNVSEGQSGGGLYNEAWELIGMALDVGPSGVYARPIGPILDDLRKWGIPITLTIRPVKQRARGADEIARERASVAEARRLVSDSILSEETDPELAVLIAAQSVTTTWQPTHSVLTEAEQQLHQSIRVSHVRHTVGMRYGEISAIAWSPDSKRIATGSGDKVAEVWDAETEKELLSLGGHSSRITSVVWSPDGRRLATGSEDGTAKIWDSATGTELLTLRGHKGSVWSVAWNSDGKRLATGSEDGTAKVWNAATGAELLTLSGRTGSSASDVRSVAWSPDGTELAAGNWDNTVKVWDAATSTQLLILTGHNGQILSVAWSPDGSRLATGNADGSADVWDTVTGHKLRTVGMHRGWTTSVAWSPDGEMLATGGFDGVAKVWYIGPRSPGTVRGTPVLPPQVGMIAKGAPPLPPPPVAEALVTLRGHTGSVECVAWSPNGKWLATASSDKTAKVWDPTGDKELLTLSGHSFGAKNVAWSPDGKQLAVATGRDAARVWDSADGTQLLSLNVDGAKSVAWSPDGKQLATGSSGGLAMVWDVRTGNEVLTLMRGYAGYVYGVAWSPDGNLLATASGNYLTTASDFNIAKVWVAKTGKELFTLRGHTGPVTSVAWSPNGNLLATASGNLQLTPRGNSRETDADDNIAKVWDAKTGQELFTLRGHTGPVTSVAWSPDGKRLVTGSTDGTARVWDVETGKQLLNLIGHSGAVTSAVWNPDGQRLATASNDRTAKVWNAVTGDELLTLGGHTSYVNGVAWSPDGKLLATANDDGKVQVYAVDIRDLMALARERVTAHPSEEGCKKYLHVDKCPAVPDLSTEIE